MTKDNILELIKSGSQLLPVIYKDLAQPGVKKAGQALATVVALANTALLPLALINEKSQLIFQAHMDKYRRRLENIPEEKINPVPPEIGVPILERLAYTTSGDVADMFVNLLASASSKETIDLAHPSFVGCISSMSSDEARLVQFLSSTDLIPCIQIMALQKDKKGIVDVCKLTSLGKKIEFMSPNNIEMYLDNFVTMGLLSYYEQKALVDLTRYADVIAIFDDVKEELLAGLKTNIGAEAYDIVNHIPIRDNRKYVEYALLGRLFPNAPGQNIAELSYEEGFYKVTHYGKLFVRACTRT